MVSVRRGVADRRVACDAPAMSIPDVGDVAPEIALPDETGAIHRLADQRGRWHRLLLLPDGRHPRLHRRSVRIPRCQRDHQRARRRASWVSPQGAQSKKSFREKFDLPFMLDEAHAAAEEMARGSRRMTARRTWARRVAPSSWVRTVDREDLGEGEAQQHAPTSSASHTLQATRAG